MKPFNLTLAKQGHPLITRDGSKVVQFTHLEEPYPQESGDVLISVLETGLEIYSYLNGAYHDAGENPSDLFLDDSTPWQPELKEGDDIEVVFNGVWAKRKLIKKCSDGVVVVSDLALEDYLEGRAFDTTIYSHDDWRIPTPSNKITLTVNGEVIDLNIDDSTLAKIKALL